MVYKVKNKDEAAKLELNVIRASSDAGALIAKHLEQLQKQIGAQKRIIDKQQRALRVLEEQVYPAYAEKMLSDMAGHIERQE